MYRYIVLAGLSMIVAGCGLQTDAQANGSSAAVASEAKTSPIAFQLRDWSMTVEDTTYGAKTYNGRGTLVTRDARLAKGNHLVFVSAKQAHDHDSVFRTMVLVRDGIGTLETSDYQTSEEEKAKEVVKYYDWATLGYVELKPATVSTDDAATPGTAAGG